MKMVYFNGANDVMGRPSGSTEDQCGDGIVHRGVDKETSWPVFTLCFEMSEQEREEFLRTGRVFLQTYGQGMQPVSATVWNPVEQGWVADRTPLQPNHPALIKAKELFKSETV